MVVQGRSVTVRDKLVERRTSGVLRTGVTDSRLAVGKVVLAVDKLTTLVRQAVIPKVGRFGRPTLHGLNANNFVGNEFREDPAHKWEGELLESTMLPTVVAPLPGTASESIPSF